MIQSTLFDKHAIAPPIASGCSGRRADAPLYFNQPTRYTMGVPCKRLTLDDAYALDRFGKQAVVEHLELAEKLGGEPILIFRTSALPYEYSTESERKYGVPARLAIVTRESLTHEIIVFSEKPSKGKR
ncbi:MAG: hypothetical protein MSG64_19715 [Pyrinomonadaceae bacterium MAG19_C2-C3]|nr:hypothetical protein [Pyrinomonadaceae bacterium MAG19_C2-C3]